jgi:tRNA threonylcarbamoyladenosine biosynthesis protein TsaE
MPICSTSSSDETKRIAASIGKSLKPGDNVILQGNLGSGKTTFVQGLAHGMGVSMPVTSPTFTLVHEYPAQGPKLIHVDPYRLENPEQIVELGFDEWLEQDGVLVVEWAERLGHLTPDEYLLVKLEILGDDERRITLEPHGTRWDKLLQELEAASC